MVFLLSKFKDPSVCSNQGRASQSTGKIISRSAGSDSFLPSGCTEARQITPRQCFSKDEKTELSKSVSALNPDSQWTFPEERFASPFFFRSASDLQKFCFVDLHSRSSKNDCSWQSKTAKRLKNWMLSRYYLQIHVPNPRAWSDESNLSKNFSEHGIFILTNLSVSQY